jgi:hypothetical protein
MLLLSPLVIWLRSQCHWTHQRVSCTGAAPHAAALKAVCAEKHRGFGFVRYEDVDDADAALDNMHSAFLLPVFALSCTFSLTLQAQIASYMAE